MKTKQCDLCEKYFDETKVEQVKNKQGQLKYLCLSCSDKLMWDNARIWDNHVRHSQPPIKKKTPYTFGFMLGYVLSLWFITLSSLNELLFSCCVGLGLSILSLTFERRVN